MLNLGGFVKISGKPLGKLGRFSEGLDPGPAQGLTWASPGLDPGQPRSIFWSRFWSNRTTETTEGTETTKGRARFGDGQVVPAHQLDDIDEAHQVDPVHQVDHKDEFTCSTMAIF